VYIFDNALSNMFLMEDIRIEMYGNTSIQKMPLTGLVGDKPMLKNFHCSNYSMGILDVNDLAGITITNTPVLESFYLMWYANTLMGSNISFFENMF